jgi:hypothetical protein
VCKCAHHIPGRRGRGKSLRASIHGYEASCRLLIGGRPMDHDPRPSSDMERAGSQGDWVRPSCEVPLAGSVVSRRWVPAGPTLRPSACPRVAPATVERTDSRGNRRTHRVLPSSATACPPRKPVAEPRRRQDWAPRSPYS